MKSAPLDITVHPSLSDISEGAWNALLRYDSPFTRYAFVRLLETSGCVGGRSGWAPSYIAVRKNGRLVGAMPSYLRDDSYGEYIFDWSWAQAAQRAGIRYYPKVTAAVPFTPATGERLFVHPDVERGPVIDALVAGLRALTNESESSSAHVLFCLNAEADELAARGFIRRATHQYHWRNDDYASFDDFLSTLRHENRKQIKRERRKVVEQGVSIARLRGSEARDADWRAMFELYRSTTDRKWGSPYLTEAFFEQAKSAVGDSAILTFAKRDATLIAGTLSFEHGKHVFGRYWGALEHVDSLHFELCYYQLIEYAIANKRTLVEAGAQGDHKLKRGFAPVAVHSAHAIEHPQLRTAVARACRDERRQLEALLPEWARHAPFREGAAPKLPPLAGLATSDDVHSITIAIAGTGIAEVGAEHE